MTLAPEAWSELPGGEILRDGLDDLARGIESVPALLVLIAAPRFRRLGIRTPLADDSSNLELRLYRTLCERNGRDAYGQYNAWLRRLTSLAHALELRAARARRLAGPTTPRRASGGATD